MRRPKGFVPRAVCRAVRFLPAAVLLAACVLAPSAEAATVERTVRALEGEACGNATGYCFDVTEIRLAAGDRLRVVFENPAANADVHNWCADVGLDHHCAPAHHALARPGDPPASVEFRLPVAGAFDFYCDPHRAVGMNGVIVVEGASGGERRQPGFELSLFAVAVLGALTLATRAPRA